MTPTGTRALAWRQTVVIALLFAGYASYYFCRADLSVGLPLIVRELQLSGMSASAATIRLGSMASFGVLAYAIGKFLLAHLGDFWGGRWSFLIGLAGAVVFTLLFSAGHSLPIFFLAWIGNRFVQSIGWAGLVKTCAGWFSYRSYGTMIGILSLSFLAGDAVARQWMGLLIARGGSWRSLFYLAASVAGVVLFANILFLRRDRMSIGFSEPEQNPLNVTEQQQHAKGRIAALLRNPAFLLVCFLSFGTTIVRETFNLWTPTYLQNAFGYSDSMAASLSATFPWVGAVSVLLAGWAGDRLGPRGRSIIMFCGMAVTSISLILLTSLHRGAPNLLPIVAIGLVAFGLLGPYSYLAGALALDFGGRKAGATSSGLIDGIGYLGGVLAGDTVARVSVHAGWNAVFIGLAALCVLSALAAAVLFVYQRPRR